MLNCTRNKQDCCMGQVLSPKRLPVCECCVKSKRNFPYLNVELASLNNASIRGRLVTDDWLRVLGAPSVFALGDCAVVDDKPLPQTAQVMR